MSVLMSMIVYPATQASLLFFFNDTATTEIYTLSLHDALPICTRLLEILKAEMGFPDHPLGARVQDRKGQFPRNRLQKLDRFFKNPHPKRNAAFQVRNEGIRRSLPQLIEELKRR